LQFLPRAGCLAVPVTLRGRAGTWARYTAVVDTGSPFLTAPPTRAILDVTTPSRRYPSTQEQYGSTIGQDIRWRSTTRSSSPIQLGTTSFPTLEPFVLALSSGGLMEATGGIFLGLMATDDERPAVLEQLGLHSLRIDYRQRILQLSTQPLLPMRTNHHLSPPSTMDRNNHVMNLFDLSPFGPNLHHYAVECHELIFFSRSASSSRTKRQSIPLSKLSRTVVVVIDTGLSGCILSDSWRHEALPSGPLGQLSGMQLGLGNAERGGVVTQLQSNDTYWYVDCFRLPWFTKEEDHPHIIAAGATFLQNSVISIDNQARTIAIQVPT